MGRGKTKKTARDIYKRTLDIEFERDRSIRLGSTIGYGWATSWWAKDLDGIGGP